MAVTNQERVGKAMELLRQGLAPFVALQPHYNLMHRDEYEGDLQDLCAREHLACAPYFALAMGLVTGLPANAAAALA